MQSVRKWPMDKSKLREKFLRDRETIPETEKIRKSKTITELVLSSSFYNDAKKIFCFISVPGEPDTAEIILDAFSRGKAVCIPRTKPGRVMETVLVDLDVYKSAAEDWPVVLGIPEPPLSLGQTDPAECDLVLVPSVAVDIYGYRLGHGGSYYDAFIAQSIKNQKRPVFLAIQFSELLRSEVLPREEHDMKVDLIATENGIITPLSV